MELIDLTIDEEQTNILNSNLKSDDWMVSIDIGVKNLACVVYSRINCCFINCNVTSVLETNKIDAIHISKAVYIFMEATMNELNGEVTVVV